MVKPNRRSRLKAVIRKITLAREEVDSVLDVIAEMIAEELEGQDDAEVRLAHLEATVSERLPALERTVEGLKRVTEAMVDALAATQGVELDDDDSGVHTL